MPYKPKQVVDAVLKEYMETGFKLPEIAARHGVTPPTITAWVHRAKLPLRSRGRRKVYAPSEQDRQILLAVQQEKLSYTEAGRRFNCSRQNVFRVMQHWKEYKALELTLVPDDIILWKSKKLRVVELNEGGTTGTVCTATGDLVPNFKFVYKGYAVSKIGHDPAFGLKAA